MLAESLEADVLLLLTDVPHVERGFGTAEAKPILRATPAALRREDFPAARWARRSKPCADSWN